MMTDGTHRSAGTPEPPDEDAALWRLLDRQAPPPVSPYFARRVLRAVALEEEARAAGWRARLGDWWPETRRLARWSGALALGLVCLTGALQWRRTPQVPAAPPAPAVALNPAPALAAPAEPPIPAEEIASARDVEIIADLDTLLQREENRLWTEDTARF